MKFRTKSMFATGAITVALAMVTLSIAPAAMADEVIDPSTTSSIEVIQTEDVSTTDSPETGAPSTDVVVEEVTTDTNTTSVPEENGVVQDETVQTTDTVQAEAEADPNQGTVVEQASTEGSAPEVVAVETPITAAPADEKPADLPIVAPTISLTSADGYTVTFGLEGGSNWNSGALYGRALKEGEDEFYGARGQSITPGQTSVTITMPEIPGPFEFYVGVNLLSDNANLGGDQSNFVQVVLPVEEPEEQTRVVTETRISSTSVDCDTKTAVDQFEQRYVKERLDAKTGEWVYVEAGIWKYAYDGEPRQATDSELTNAKCEVVLPPVDPETPTQPEVPTQPETPTQPEVPTQPEAPAHPEAPVQAETPVQPSTKVEHPMVFTPAAKEDAHEASSAKQLAATGTQDPIGFIAAGAFLVLMGGVATMIRRRKPQQR